MVVNLGSSRADVRPVAGSTTYSRARSPSAGRCPIALRQRLQDLCQPQAWPAGRLDHRGVGFGGAELGVTGVQVSDPARQPLVPAFGQIPEASNLMRNVTGHLTAPFPRLLQDEG